MDYSRDKQCQQVTFSMMLSKCYERLQGRSYAKFSEQLIGREMQKIGEVFAAAN